LALGSLRRLILFLATRDNPKHIVWQDWVRGIGDDMNTWLSDGSTDRAISGSIVSDLLVICSARGGAPATS
jgi:hypothetical protein